MSRFASVAPRNATLAVVANNHVASRPAVKHQPAKFDNYHDPVTITFSSQRDSVFFQDSF